MSNVLLIEPDVILARTYTKAFELEGHTIAHAYTAQQAIYLADELKPDAIILELQLAIHSGIEFLYEFRSYSEWQTVPIIINTYMHPNTLMKSMEVLQRDLGVVTCFYKPRTTLQMLLKTIRKQTLTA